MFTEPAMTGSAGISGTAILDKPSVTSAVGIDRGFSLYIDLIRIVAALEVVLFHLGYVDVTGGAATALGHEAVVVFFVLSGYVVSFAACDRDKTLKHFAISRLTRIYSVAVPALILTIALDYGGLYLSPSLYAGDAPLQWPIIRFIVSFFLMNETWLSIQSFSNSPVWSVSYELAYYAIFAAYFFLRGTQRRALLLIVILFVGPRPMLLFPLWIAGSWTYLERHSAGWPKGVHWGLFLVLIPGLWAYSRLAIGGIAVQSIAAHAGYAGPLYDFGHSRFFVTDYCLGLLFALHLLGAKNLGPSLALALGRAAPALRWLSDYSFTIYLVHLPTMLFVRAVIGVKAPSAAGVASIVIAVLAVTVVVGFFTEHQRHRLKRWINRLAFSGAPPLAAVRPAADPA